MKVAQAPSLPPGFRFTGLPVFQSHPPNAAADLQEPLMPSKELEASLIARKQLGEMCRHGT